MFTLDIHQSNRINNMSREQLKTAIKLQGLSDILKRRGFTFTASNEVLRSILMSDINNSYRKATKAVNHNYDTCQVYDGFLTDENIFDAITLERNKPYIPSPFIKHMLSGKSVFPNLNKTMKSKFKC